MKNNKVELSLLILFLLIILLSLTLFSCKKDNNWDCKAVYHFHVVDSNLDTLHCHWTMTKIGIPLDNMSYDQIHAVEQANTRKGYFLWYGELWYVESTEHCIPAYCPKHW